MSSHTEILNLINEFYKEHKKILLSSIIFKIMYVLIESIIIPIILSDLFNVIDVQKLKKNLITLVIIWVVIKIIFAVTQFFNSQIDPAISKFIILKVMKNVFDKFEKENEQIPVSILITKVVLIINNLHDLFYLIFEIFIPRIIVLFLTVRYSLQ